MKQIKISLEKVKKFANIQSDEEMCDVSFNFGGVEICNPWRNENNTAILSDDEAVKVYGVENVMQFIEDAKKYLLKLKSDYLLLYGKKVVLEDRRYESQYGCYRERTIVCDNKCYIHKMHNGEVVEINCCEDEYKMLNVVNDLGKGILILEDDVTYVCDSDETLMTLESQVDGKMYNVVQYESDGYDNPVSFVLKCVECD